MKKARSIDKKHHKIIKDYDEKAQQLKSKPIKGDFLKNF